VSLLRALIPLPQVVQAKHVEGATAGAVLGADLVGIDRGRDVDLAALDDDVLGSADLHALQVDRCAALQQHAALAAGDGAGRGRVAGDVQAVSMRLVLHEDRDVHLTRRRAAL